jgi:TolB-like protein/Tfp pilus assembly protein PilF
MNEHRDHGSTFRFGVFEFDSRSGELRKHGIRIALQDKPAQMLRTLLARAGEVVSREELSASLWQNSTFVDFDHSINIAASKLRQALGDSGGSPRFLETVSRHGYRFLAPVQSGADRSERPRKIMLAVMPFVNMGGEAGENYFSDGLTEEMITALGRLDPRRLGVIARMTAMHYKGDTRAVDAIGRELGVDYVLEGSSRRSSDRVRITAQLVQVSDQTHLWAQTYDRKCADVLDIQREVARRIARSLAIELMPAEQATLSRGAPRNVPAHEAYWKGRYFWSRRTEESFGRALKCFEQAIELDPGCALAYAGIADAYNTLGLYSAVPPEIGWRRAAEATHRALAIDPSLAEAHSALGYCKALYEWDWAGSEREFRTAIELNTNYVTAHQWYGHLLAMTGRFPEAFARFDAALLLDPLSLVASSHQGWILYFARRFDDAAERLRATLEMDAMFGLGLYFLGLTYLAANRPEDAIREFEKGLLVSPGQPAVLSGLGQAYGTLGCESEARGYLDALDRQRAARYVTPYFSACIHIRLREYSRALSLLESACDQRCPWMAYLKVDPAVDQLRREPRHRALLRRIGFDGS